MSGPYATLEAYPLLVLHQQSHLPQLFFLQQFLVFLLVGQVDLYRRHLGFKKIHLKQLPTSNFSFVSNIYNQTQG